MEEEEQIAKKRHAKQLDKEILHIVDVLKKRNKTLARVLRLELVSRFGFLDKQKFQPKRGKKPSSLVPSIKEAMHILGVNHRTAQDYVHFLEALRKIDEVSRIRMKLAAGISARMQRSSEKS